VHHSSVRWENAYVLGGVNMFITRYDRSRHLTHRWTCHDVPARMRHHDGLAGFAHASAAVDSGRG
jgi:hypothetical protein